MISACWNAEMVDMGDDGLVSKQEYRRRNEEARPKYEVSFDRLPNCPEPSPLEDFEP